MVKEKIKLITDHDTKPIIVFDGGMFDTCDHSKSERYG